MKITFGSKKVKHFEEILGITGVVYLLVMIFVVFLLVKFLVGISLELLKEAKNSKTLPDSFQIEMAESALSNWTVNQK
ncbi:MAG: hypothetical protein QMD65_02450 [Patescibacteria group bacterium]|nr:hypothetical protein [Patescibacteria group bacterium]